jgi:pyruvate formate lyase activating enzyme
MQGIVFDIRHFSVHDGPGIRTTVFMKGCPLSCRWCHNPEGIQPSIEEIDTSVFLDGREIRRRTKVGKLYTPEEVLEQIIKSRIFFEESGGGVTFSGGEPLMQADFLSECLALCNKEGIPTAVDTCGYATEKIFETIAKDCKLLLYDLKHTDEQKHIAYTGKGTELIRKNLLLAAVTTEVIIRIPLIPGFNDDLSLHRDIAALMISLGLRKADLLPWHRMSKAKYQKLNRTCLYDEQESPASLKDSIAKIYSDAGILVHCGG